MSSPSVWFANNDMLLSMAGLKSSTMGSTSFLNSSSNLSCTVWKAPSTTLVANRVVNAQNVPYLAASNGNYRTVIQSTQHTMTAGLVGLAIFVLNHSGLNGEWRVPFHVEFRGDT